MPPRKGGGRKAFLKGVKGGDSDDEAAAPAATERKQAGEKSKPAKADKSSAFKLDAQPAKAPAAAAAAPATAAAADNGGEAVDSNETRGHLMQRHKRELKALKEQQKKLGKKHRDEAIQLEEAITARHAAETAALALREGGANPDADMEAVAVADSLYSVRLDDTAPERTKKPTKAQRQREKKAAREAEREERILQEQAAMPESERRGEDRALRALLRPLGMRVHDIPPDGHCLYRSVEHQLGLSSDDPYSLDVQGLRKAAADYMRAHKADFMPFLEEDEEGGASGSDGDSSDAEAPPSTAAKGRGRGALAAAGGKSGDDEGAIIGDREKERREREAAAGARMAEKRADGIFRQYCKRVEGTAQWGGNLELQALAASLRRQLVVYAVGLPPVVLGEQHADKGEPLRLCYHRHSYALGEHYNSVVQGAAPESEGEEEQGGQAPAEDGGGE